MVIDVQVCWVHEPLGAFPPGRFEANMGGVSGVGVVGIGVGEFKEVCLGLMAVFGCGRLAGGGFALRKQCVLRWLLLAFVE